MERHVYKRVVYKQQQAAPPCLQPVQGSRARVTACSRRPDFIIMLIDSSEMFIDYATDGAHRSSDRVASTTRYAFRPHFKTCVRLWSSTGISACACRVRACARDTFDFIVRKVIVLPHAQTTHLLLWISCDGATCLQACCLQAATGGAAMFTTGPRFESACYCL